MSNWIYQDKEIITPPEGYLGFVYIIECLPTNQKYIGRKQFFSTTRKAPLKGKTRKRKMVKESDWANYYGSSDYMKELVLTYGKESFKREIVRLCKSKSELSYYETKLIFTTDALIKDEYINRWLSAQINGNNLSYLKDEVLDDRSATERATSTGTTETEYFDTESIAGIISD